MPDQTSVDPVAVVLAWLQTHAGVLAAFGDAAHVSGVVEAPWPHLRVAPGPGGSLRDGVWALDEDVLLEVYGDPSGAPGEAGMRHLMLVAVSAVRELVDVAAETTDVVVSDVISVGIPRPQQAPWTVGVRQQATTSGQSRWSMVMRVVAHPPVADPPAAGS